MYKFRIMQMSYVVKNRNVMTLHVCVWIRDVEKERGREKERERETDRQTDRQTDREKEKRQLIEKAPYHNMISRMNTTPPETKNVPSPKFSFTRAA